MKVNEEKLGNNKIISNIFDIKEIFEILNAIVCDCKLHILEHGWKMSALDPANIASVEIDIPEECFNGYNIKNPFIIILDISEILNILEGKEGYRPIEISLESIYEDNTEKYKTKFRIGNITHSFISPKVENDIIFPKFKDKTKKIVHISTKDNEEISANLIHFREIIKSCKYVSDYALFENKDGKIRICSEDDYRDVETFIGNNITRNVKSIFDTYYLEDMINKIDNRSNNTITLCLGVDWPMTIKFKICRYGKGIYTIAPRIE